MYLYTYKFISMVSLYHSGGHLPTALVERHDDQTRTSAAALRVHLSVELVWLGTPLGAHGGDNGGASLQQDLGNWLGYAPWGQACDESDLPL